MISHGHPVMRDLRKYTNVLISGSGRVR